MKKLLTALLFAPLMALASGAALHLDKAPDVSGDNAALQNGAKLFVNYCLNCHGASFMRYNRLTGIGLTEQQIKDSLLFTADKVGEPMRVAIRPDEAKQWFGATPPDLTLIARARASEHGPGADWLYTYLRSFYRDDKRPTGWNNVVFENVGMPHILWEMQGQQVLNHETHKLELAVPGTLSPAEYDKQIADLVGFLVYMGEPIAGLRKQLGIAVLLFLGVLFVVAYALKREYWKDVH
ncbi:cytochrome c [Azospira sp. I13]|jgi:ubiquinol-cytochrome c reductase cytochrome c1 subunit|uniref:cytochrome c1 n=1 Tax=Azospira sp. I13 TaxID=1765050 RepID=UPI000D4D889B|nr:cytochrome c1 [Azospira sp. I13]GBG02991.1 cytochrome c [Azospira sp. I13]